MPAGLATALLFFAQAVAGPPAPAKQSPASAPTTQRDCAPQNSSGSANEIVICAVKPDGYRLPPDIVEARRLKKQRDSGRPRSPHETYADHSCATVGPMGCRGTPAVNLVAVALTAAQMADRLSKGQEVGSMFKTDPQASEYELYQQAKKAREAKEAAAKAQAVAEQARAKAVAEKQKGNYASGQTPASGTSQ